MAAEAFQKCSNNISIHAKQCLYFHILISYLWTFIYFSFIYYYFFYSSAFCKMRFNLLSENTTSSTDSRMPNASASALKLIKYVYVYLLFWKQQFYGIKIWNLYRWWIFLGGFTHVRNNREKMVTHMITKIQINIFKIAFLNPKTLRIYLHL